MSPVGLLLSKKKEIKKEMPYKEGLVEDIGSATGIPLYEGHGYEGGMFGVCMRS